MAEDILKVDCQCGKTIKVRSSSAGKKVRCPQCQSVVAIPNLASGDAAVIESIPEIDLKPAAVPPTPIAEVQSQPKPPAKPQQPAKSQPATKTKPATKSKPATKTKTVAKPKPASSTPPVPTPQSASDPIPFIQVSDPTPAAADPIGPIHIQTDAEPAATQSTGVNPLVSQTPGVTTPVVTTPSITTPETINPGILNPDINPAATSPYAIAPAGPATRADPAAIASSGSSAANEPARVYPMLTAIIWVYRISAGLTLLLGLLAAVGAVMSGGPIMFWAIPAATSLLGGMIGAATLWAFSELIQLLLHIQDNTHRAAQPSQLSRRAR